jgi:voltage-gated potassium channel
MNRMIDKLIHHVVNSTDSFRELFALYFGIVAAAALVFSYAEDKSFGDSLWWSFVTAMTVGYGDFAPVTLIGRAVAVVLMHIVPLFVIPLVVVRLLRTVVRDENEFSHLEQETMKADIAAIRKALKIE